MLKFQSSSDMLLKMVIQFLCLDDCSGGKYFSGTGWKTLFTTEQDRGVTTHMRPKLAEHTMEGRHHSAVPE